MPPRRALGRGCNSQPLPGDRPRWKAAKAFYGQLFGWSFAPDGAYTLITAPGAAGPSGGIFNTGGNIPP